MQYEKTVKDTYGDNVNVETESNSNVYLFVFDSAADSRSIASLTPDQAREVAKRLKRAANVAEGKPAKANKGPAALYDRDGARWDRTAAGRYAFLGALPGLTRADLDTAYGPLTVMEAHA